MPLIKIISGGQTGADIAGLKAAKQFGLATGGWMPLGFKTLTGPKPEYESLYGIVQHSSSHYSPRTQLNVRDADATIRIAKDFNSPGEKLTLKAIVKLKKLSFDVQVPANRGRRTSSTQTPKLVAEWLNKMGIQTLNVAGNSESTFSGMEKWAYDYLVAVLSVL